MFHIELAQTGRLLTTFVQSTSISAIISAFPSLHSFLGVVREGNVPLGQQYGCSNPKHVCPNGQHVGLISLAGSWQSTGASAGQPGLGRPSAQPPLYVARSRIWGTRRGKRFGDARVVDSSKAAERSEKAIVE